METHMHEDSQAFCEPSLDSITVVGYRLAGYFDVPASMPRGNTDREPTVIDALESLQEEAKCLRYFIRKMLAQEAVRVFVYLLDAAFISASVALHAGVPLATLSESYRICKPCFGPSLRYVMEHLKSDWSRAWIGLYDFRINAGKPDVHLEKTYQRHAQEQKERYRRTRDVESACCVLGCCDHLSEKMRSLEEWTKKFSFSECLAMLRPPQPVNLLAMTGGLENRLLRLPEQIASAYLGFLDAQCFKHLNTTCKTLCAITMDTFAGLKVKLLPHQRAALRWMLHREQRFPKALLPPKSRAFDKAYHPCRKLFRCIGGKETFAFDSLHLAIVADGDHNMIRPVRGGLFCDDPGLGKTITTIGLILRTYKKLSQAPQGFTVHGDQCEANELESGATDALPNLSGAASNACQEKHIVNPYYVVSLAQENGSGSWFRESALGHASHGKRRESSRLQMKRQSHGLQLRVYLSCATLIICPFELVDHWVYQLEKHVSVKLKIIVMNSDEKLNVTSFQLKKADVVIVDFKTTGRLWHRWKDRNVLMGVHWSRIAIDEGHQLGSSNAMSNKMRSCCELPADCRWILTGTPAPRRRDLPQGTVGTSASNASRVGYGLSGVTSPIRHIRPLLEFLHVDPWGHPSAAKHFQAAVERPFLFSEKIGLKRVEHLLKRLMIRTDKELVMQSVPLKINDCILEFNDAHAESYNRLADLVQRNLLLTDWQDEHHKESLLHPDNWKLASSTVQNILESCCVAGHMNFSAGSSERNIYSTDDIKDTVETLKGSGVIKSSEEGLALEKCLRFGCECSKCRVYVRLPIVMPCCARTICASCALPNLSQCSLCQNQFKMQSVNDPARRENNDAPQWEVPVELIELQPAYEQTKWTENWQQTTSTKVEFLISKLTGTQDPSSGGLSKNPILGKVIVFSKFPNHFHLIREELQQENILFSDFAGVTSRQKASELDRFRHDPGVKVLLLNSSGAVGLDLSFVSHVFLMEPIYDRSLESQIIARAWRMGAKGAVHVYRLAMAGSVEEVILKSCSAASMKENSQVGEAENDDLSKRRKILMNTKTVTSSESDQASERSTPKSFPHRQSVTLTSCFAKSRRWDAQPQLNSDGTFPSSSSDHFTMHNTPSSISEFPSSHVPMPQSSCLSSSSSSSPSMPLSFRSYLSPNSCGSSQRMSSYTPFIRADVFCGKRDGYYFTNGRHGLGYYIDSEAPRKRKRARFA